jgi:hypothetical protein
VCCFFPAIGAPGADEAVGLRHQLEFPQGASHVSGHHGRRYLFCVLLLYAHVAPRLRLAVLMGGAMRGRTICCRCMLILQHACVLILLCA